ncbi:substrate-binding periplasmic protein [Kiloniella antarctica]|uniref:Substrate-binding periplasmic protein n=1 Tax=Kiloniella antarctica TaxID=1550907 RepID=A0ABW5BMJ7_9PROT
MITIFCVPFSLRAEQSHKPVFKIAYAEAWAPISSGSFETVVGILPSIMEEVIHNQMGIVVLHQGLPWARAQEAVKTGEIDAFITTPTTERLTFSKPSEGIVFPLRFQPIVRVGSEEEKLFTSESDILGKLATRRYCDVLGNGWAKNFYAEKGISYKVVPTLDICIKHLIHGQTDIIIHAEPAAVSFITKLNVHNSVKILPIIMVSSPEFPLLLSKKSTFDHYFLAEFDAALSKIKNHGVWEALLRSSSAASN